MVVYNCPTTGLAQAGGLEPPNHELTARRSTIGLRLNIVTNCCKDYGALHFFPCGPLVLRVVPQHPTIRGMWLGGI